MSNSPTTPQEAWDLLPLTPGFIESEHSGYAATIIKALEDPSVRNIAISGTYGVGKSSILQRVSELKKDQVVELSLSTLAPIAKSSLDESVPVQATTATNRIQQEIVKQLLYREVPNKAPGSRFRRIERFDWRRGVALACLIALIGVLVFLIAGWGAIVAKVLKQLVDLGLWVYPLLFAVIACGAFAFMYLLHGRLHVRQFSAGPAAVTLDQKSVSYFDQYLDEIVYFFETSNRNIVIFEDIDRFNDSHIFETLRSLNTLLNASPQIKRPIRFIYAIKDSIFDRIGLELEGRKLDATILSIKDPARAEAMRANRTKFFDLVVPVVPFITHRSARNLTSQILDGIEHDVSMDLIDLAGRFVPDMRLLKNVRNEFVVFRDRIFSGDGSLLELSQTDLFAMMLYKSTHLSDFEAIRLGKSTLDQLYATSRDLVNTNIKRIQREIRANRQEKIRAGNSDVRSARLGDRLVEHIGRTIRAANYYEQNQRYSLSRIAKTPEELKTVEFWREFAEAADGVTIEWRNNHGQSLTFPREDLSAALGERFELGAWEQSDRESLDLTLSEKVEQLKFLRSADMGDLIKRPEFMVEYEAVTQSLESVAERLLTRGLALQLVRAGYINGNFTLHTSTFHGDRVSPAATNFIIHHVERDLMDEHFKLSGEDVDAVIRERGQSALAEPALFNIAILDHLLRTSNNGSADVMVESLARFNANAKRFLQAYLSSGTEQLEFLTRLVRKTPRILTYLVSQVELDDTSRVELVSHALANLIDTVAYEVDKATAKFLDEHHRELTVLDSSLSKPGASRLASVFESAKIRLPSLGRLSDTVRQAFVERNLYVLDRDNLVSALGDEAGLSLDTIRAVNERVYRYVLANLAAYLVAIGDDAVISAAGAEFVQTIEDVLESGPERLEEVVRRASRASLIDDITETPEAAWPILARFNRFPCTFANVSTYIEKVGSLDSDVAEVLSSAGSVSVGDMHQQSERESFALTVLESWQVLSAELRAQLVASLGLSEYLDASDITPEHGSLFVHLLEMDIIEDDADTWAHLTETDWATREGMICASARAKDLITPAFVGDDLASLMGSDRVPADVKIAITLRADEFAATAGRAGLAELAEFAADQSQPIGAAVVETMAANGAASKNIVALLNPHLEDISDERLFGVLRTLGDDFPQLSTVGRDKPKIPRTPGAIELLESLKNRGIVKSYDRANDPIKVNKRYK